MNEELTEILSTFGISSPKLITEDSCTADGVKMASAMHLTCDGFQEEIGKYYLSDDEHIISDTMRVSFFAKTFDDAVEKLVGKLKQFNPDTWKERLTRWMSMIDDATLKSKAGTFLV